MRDFIIRAVVCAVGLWLASEIVPGVTITGWPSLVLAAVLLGVANALVAPVLFILTLPITIVTLGLFIFVLNGLMVLLVDWLLKGFYVDGLISAIMTAIIVALVGWVTSWLFKGEARRAN